VSKLKSSEATERRKERKEKSLYLFIILIGQRTPGFLYSQDIQGLGSLN
jgi:hypothetical protein